MTTEYPDLSLISTPISDFLALSGDTYPISDEALKKYSLSKAQLSFYEENGFLDGVQIVNEAQLNRLREELDKIMTDPLGLDRYYILHWPSSSYAMEE